MNSINRFLSHVDKTDYCWIWDGFKDKQGYGRCSFGKYKGTAAHRISYLLFVGEIPKGLCICHKCDNTSCVNPDHLFAATQADNVKDMHNKNRHRALNGEKVRLAKLTESQVKSMRKEFSEGVTYYKLSEKYKVTHSTCQKIVKRQTWKHIK